MNGVRSIEEIIGQLRSKGEPTTYKAPEINVFGKDDHKIQDIQYDIPKSAIYDRLSDGSFIAKYNNYAGAIGNEDRLAKQQSWYEQAGLGITKNVGKALNYALDATVGTVYGIYSGISEGSLSAAWDNDFSNMLDDWNKKLDNKLPSYYSDEEKSNGLLAAIPGFGATNFWFNDVLGGAAFVAGAVLPQIVIGALTGGTSLGAGLAKVGASTAIKNATKAGKAIDKIADATKFAQGRDIIRGGHRAIFGKKAGDVIHTADFLVRTSGFEAGMEARHNFKDAVSTYMETFEDKNGRPPSQEEIGSFMGKARKAANGVFTANMAILSISNAAMFGKAFNLKTPSFSTSSQSSFSKAIGLGTKQELVEEAGQKVLKTVVLAETKGQKILGNAYKILGKPAMEGIYEEGTQGVAGKTMQNYLESKYDPEVTDGYSSWAAFSDAFADQYGTKEGWKEMGIGMIIGFAGGGMQPGGIKSGQALSGFGKDSRKAARTQLEEDVVKLNAGVTALRSMNSASSIRNFRNISDKKSDVSENTSTENSLISFAFIKSQEHMKSPSEIKQDFEVVIDNMQLDQEAMDMLESSGLDAQAYKESLKGEFKADLDAYNYAKNVVEALGINERVKLSDGNIIEVKDALTSTFMLGKRSEAQAKNISNQIGKLIGVDGMFDYMQHYNSLPAEQKAAVENLRQKKEDLTNAQEAAKSIGIKIASLKRPSDKKNDVYNTEAMKLTTAQVRVNELQEEVDGLSQAIEKNFIATNFNMDGDSLIDNPNVSIAEVLENLDKLDVYKDSLRAAGKVYEADSLDYLTSQFKVVSDANKAMTETARQMVDSNFFSSKKGSAMLNMIIGKKFIGDTELDAAIEENEEYIKNSIANFYNITPDEVDAKQALIDSILENDNLSDREKYRLSSIIRLQVGLEAVQSRIEAIQDKNVVFSTDKLTSESPLEGDTVFVKQAAEIRDRDITNIETLNQTIEEITAEIESVLNRTSVNKERISELEKEKDSLSKVGTDQEVKAQLETSLQEEEASEFKNQEIIDQLKQQIEDIKIEDNTARIAEIDKEIESLTTGFKIMDSPEYKRLNELNKKKEKEGLNEKEQKELEALNTDIDQWLLVTGTVVGGMRLSDLVRQKVVLEQTPILEVENVETVTPQDSTDNVVFTDRSADNYYENLLSWDTVSAVGVDNNMVEIAGISPEALTLEIGQEFEFKVSDKKTILIHADEVVRINAIGKVKILPTNNNLTTAYSTVTTLVQNIAGKLEQVPLKTSFKGEYTENMDREAVFSAKEGDGLTLEIDSKDSYNVGLFDAYESAVGIPNMTEEQEDALTESTFDKLKETDKIYNLKVAEADKLKEEIKTATIDQKAKKNKKLLTVNKQILSREDFLQEKAEKEVKKLKTQKASQEKIDQELEILARDMVIRVKNKDGKFVGLIKGVRASGGKGSIGEKFEALRFQIAAQKDLIPRLVATRGKETLDVKGIKVKKVYIGNPSYNFAVNENGTQEVTFVRIDETKAKKIVDIGYMQNGNMVSKSQAKGTDTTFLTKQMRNKSTSKVPFIVLEVGGKRVAYPVQTIKQEAQPLDEFTKIFKANTNQTAKAVALNKFMAARGVDIKEKNNAFMSVGNNNNLTQEFFDEMLAKMENIDYFYSLDEWLDPATDIQKVVVDQVLVDIDVVNPFHSPKIQMDISKVDVDLSVKKGAAKTQQDMSVDEQAKKLAEELREDGEQSPEDEIDTNCFD